MNIFVTVALWVLIFVGAATIVDVNIPPILDTIFLSPVFMAVIDICLRGISTILFLIPAVLFGMFWTFILTFLADVAGHDTTRDETYGLIVVLMMIVLAPLMIFAHPYIMTHWIFDGVSWSIQFSYWQYTFLNVIVLMINWPIFKASLKAGRNSTDK